MDIDTKDWKDYFITVTTVDDSNGGVLSAYSWYMPAKCPEDVHDLADEIQDLIEKGHNDMLVAPLESFVEYWDQYLGIDTHFEINVSSVVDDIAIPETSTVH